jgi:hypothetical protein
MVESDLYPPLKRFLEGQGYEVKGEVGRCDVVAVRDQEEPVLVELKLRPNLALILQGVERLALSDRVYLGVPEGCRLLRTHRKRLPKLLRRIGLGLITIEPGKERVTVVLDPLPYRPRRDAKGRARLLGEFQQRVGDPNLGGSATRAGRVTAYRQRAVAIAQHLALQGPTKASVVAAALDEPKARDVLYGNVYGWFERRGKGIYELSPKGQAELGLWTGASG